MMKRILIGLVLLVVLLTPVSASFNFTIGGTGYNFGTQFTATANTGTGTLSNYPIMLNLSNATGVSSSTMIYTNGTTLPNWYDIVFTDGSDTAFPFWIENNTATSTGATAWVKPASIATTGSNLRVYYGNSSKSSSSMNNPNTVFTFGDDMLESSYNKTNWLNSGGTTAQSGGVMTITGGSSAWAYMTTNITNGYSFGQNTSIRSLWKADAESNRWSTGRFNATSSVSGIVYVSIASVSQYEWASSATSYKDVSRTTTHTAYGVTNFNRNVTTWSIIEAGGESVYNTTIGSAPATPFILGAYSTSRTVSADWVIARPYQEPEPTTGSYTAIPGGSPTSTLLSQFSANTTTGYSSPYVVSFTDTSTGSPTTWNWTFGDGYTSTSQNPTHVYLVANSYAVSLNVTNSTGSYSTNSTTVTLNTDDDTYLKSWNHYNTTASLTSDEKGVAWSTSGSPTIDTAVKKFGAGSLNIPTGNHYIYSASSSIWDRSLVAGEIEFWLNVSTLGDAGKPIIKRSTGATGTSDGWGFYNINGTQYGWSWWEGDAAVNHTDGVYIPNNVWTHVKITRGTDNIERVYIDGALKTSKMGMLGGFDTANPLIIGSSAAGIEHAFHLDEFRFSQGVSREVGNFDVAMGQYNGSLTGGIDLSPNSTLRYKTNPGDTAIIYNQTGGGQRNRTVQIQNATAAKYISGGITYNPIRQVVKSVQLNLTNYPDLVLVSSSINNVDGEATFNVSRGGTNTIEALFDNRTNLVDFTMLYWNYTEDSTGEQYFSNGWIVDGGTYPVHNFIETNITFGAWDFYPNFTANNTSPSTSQTVLFTDTTVGYPSAWNWSWGDGTWSNGTLVNTATHQYTSAGTYNVTMVGTLWQNYSVSNSTTKTSYITVSAAPNYNVMDMYQTGVYTRTVHVTDTSNVPLAGASVVWSNGQSATTDAAGNCNVSIGAGVYSFIASLSGYYPDQLSVAVEGDGTSNIQLEKMTSSQQNVWYTPWQVRIRVVDLYGAPIPLTNVTASYIATTLPSTNVTWLVSAFGIDSTVADDMLNSDVAMSGETDDNGGLSFTMFKSLQYRLTITNTTLGVASTKTLYPTDQEYVIYVRTAGQTPVNNTLETRNATLPWYSLNSTHISLNMTYWDTGGCTSDVTFRVWFRDNGTEIHNTTWNNIGTAKVYDNHTIAKAPIGTEYLWGYNATTVC